MTARVAMKRAWDTKAPWTLPRARRFFGPLARTRLARVVAWWAVWILLLNGVWAKARGWADDIGFPVHGASIERTLFGGLPSVTLQEQIHPLAPSFVEWACVVVYTSWFIVPVLAALYVSVKAPARIGSFFMWWIAVFFVSLPLFILFPVAPPWMTDPHVLRLASLAVGDIEDTNKVAALPSLHVALPCVLAFWFVRERWNVLAIAMFAYTALIGFEVVLSGEHYAIDVIAAVAVAAAIYRGSQVDWRGIFDRARSQMVRARASESGQALIEFVFVVPFLLVLMLVMFEGGLAVSDRVELQHSVREGGRYASFGHDPSEIKNRTVSESSGLLTAPSEVDVCYEGSGAEDTKVRVRANFTYTFGVGSGELLTALGVGAPSIDMSPYTDFSLEAEATDTSGSVAWPC